MQLSYERLRIHDRMDEIDEKMRLMCIHPNRLTIDNIERILHEIEEVLHEVKSLEDCQEFRNLLLLYQSFLRVVNFYMLEYGKIDFRFSIEDFPKIIIQNIGQLVQIHHYPVGKLSLRLELPIITDLDYKLEKITLASIPSSDLPSYDTNILVTIETIEEFRNEILKRLKHETELFFSFNHLKSLEQLKQHTILSVFSNLSEDMILTETNEGFKIISKVSKGRRSQNTKIFKIQ